MENGKFDRNDYKESISKALSLSDREMRKFLEEKLESLKESKTSPDMVESVLTSHQSLCSIKEMGEKDAFGHDPAIFYSLALSGEVGELSNKLVKVIRRWGSFEEKKEAIESEIADVFIYAILLAFTSDIDPHRAVQEKCDIVNQRAADGYYGGPLVKKTTAE